MALPKESQRGAVWIIPPASNYLSPRKGARPGTACPADIVHAIVKGAHDDLNDAPVEQYQVA
eukprot:1048187-Pyramimonas_sp.AAC.1